MKKNIRLICLYICCLTMAVNAQNAPQSIAGSVVSLGTTASLPIYAMNFINISSCNLKLEYDPGVAQATSVSIGPGLGGMISTNLDIPGTIILGWFTSGGLTLPDSSVIFTVQFTKTGSGYSPVNWNDDGYSCEYNDGNFEALNDSPSSEYYFDGSLVFQSPDAPLTIVPDISAAPGSIIGIPVMVSNFTMIGSLTLNLGYDPAVLSYISCDNNSAFPQLIADGSQAGIVQVHGLVSAGNPPFSLEDNSILFTLNFEYQDGFTAISWIDNGNSCQYEGCQPVYPVLNDYPQQVFYTDGSVSANALPAAAGPITGPETVCTGSAGVAYSVPVIPYASDYVWDVPSGVSIISGQYTSSIQVDFADTTLSGGISVFGRNAFGNGSPSELQVSSIEQPSAAGPVTGSQVVCQGEAGLVYSVAPIANATYYTWTLPAGCTIVSGNLTNSIVVDFGFNATSGEINVAAANGCGQGSTSAPYAITVNEIPEILVQPISPAPVYAGSGSAQFFVQASGPDLTWQWQEYSSGWIDLVESELYVGVHSDALSIVSPGIGMNGNFYRCVVTGLCEPPAVTDGNAHLTVLLPVGLNDNLPHFDFLVFPNPCSEAVTVRFEVPLKGGISVSIVNLLGETVAFSNPGTLNPGNYTLSINTSGLKQGLYSISLNLLSGTKQMTAAKKFVCNHYKR